MARMQFWLGPLLAGVAIAPAVGCAKSDQVEHYTVRKPPPFESPQGASGGAAEQPPGEPKDRTLAAIVPHGGQAWFFKITGRKDAVAAQSDAFTTFLKSLRFSPEGKPEWTLPDGWQQRPGSDIRFATLLIPGDGEPLQLSVTALPKPPGDDEDYALVNINRWRGQMKLPPIAREQLAAESTTLDIEGTPATLVNLLGTASAGGMARPPFFPGAGNAN